MNFSSSSSSCCCATQLNSIQFDLKCNYIYIKATAIRWFLCYNILSLLISFFSTFKRERHNNNNNNTKKDLNLYLKWQYSHSLLVLSPFFSLSHSIFIKWIKFIPFVVVVESCIIILVVVHIVFYDDEYINYTIRWRG